MTHRKHPRPLFPGPAAQGGFTLVELLIAMVVVAIMGIAIVASYVSQQRAATVVREVAQLQQQLRGSMYILEYDIRLAGYNPEKTTGTFGVTDIRRRSLADGQPDGEGMPSLTVATDWQPDPPDPDLNDNGALDAGEATTYFLQTNDRGSSDLFRLPGGGAAELVAENIEHMAYAFAYENDDGEVARDGDAIIWALSSNGVVLDRRLEDDMSETALGDAIPLDRIRMVRVWLLARTWIESPRYVNSEAYPIPGLADPVFDDGFRRRMMVRTIEMRNMGL
jgi:type IV pilus assembly protein PilW